MAAWKR